MKNLSKGLIVGCLIGLRAQWSVSSFIHANKLESWNCQ